MNRIIDVHAHLADMQNLDQVIERAGEAGVSEIVAVGMTLKSNERTLQIAEEYKNGAVRIVPALGLHPWDLEEDSIQPTIAQIRENVGKACGIGEVGLDYWLKDVKHSETKKNMQREAFRGVLALARQNDKPVTIHSRGAWEDCFNLVVDSRVKRAIFHWFSGPVELLRRIIECGFYVSATPAVGYSREHRAAILETPLENLLLETDSPVKYGSLESEPRHVIVTLEEVSKLKGMDPHKISAAATENSLALYGSTV